MQHVPSKRQKHNLKPRSTYTQERNEHCVGFEVLTAVLMKSTVVWDTLPRSYTCFHAGFLLGLFLNNENGGDILTFNGLYGVISQKIVLFGINTEI
jgi:hypothetical protein